MANRRGSDGGVWVDARAGAGEAVAEGSWLLQLTCAAVCFVAGRACRGPGLAMGKHFTTLNISYEPGPTEQLENNEDGAPAETLEPPNAGRGFVRGLAEFFDPFEALGTVFEEPRLVLAFLVVLAAGGLIVLIACGLWEAVQEAFLGGGPPQGLGLK